MRPPSPLAATPFLAVAAVIVGCGGITTSSTNNADAGTGSRLGNDGPGGAKSPAGTAPSCNGLPATCGPNGNEDCCSSPLITGGTFYRSYDGERFYTDKGYPATVSDFRLDKFEITVGRFRNFVAAYSQNMIMAGAGKNLNDASDSGWSPTWIRNLPTDAAALTTVLQGLNQTWTSSAGAYENRPINYINWYEASAFCIWDGGRLPTEAEWNYAASGGSEQRMYPWGATVPAADANLAVYGCYYGGAGPCNIAPVGSVSAGNGKWGQADLAGNVWEWTLDRWRTSYSQTSCVNCADRTGVPGAPSVQGRVIRGGSFYNGASGWLPSASLLSSHRFACGDSYRINDLGARCARNP